MSGHATNELLREAFTAASVSQVELARRTGIPQGRISSYLHDRHQLTPAQLSRLTDALGFRVRLTLVPVGRRRDVTRRWVLHRAVAAKLRTDPPADWRELARANIRRSRETVHGDLPQAWLDEWQRLVDEDDPSALLETLVRFGEREEELRAVSPFAGLLTEEERRQALASAQ